MLQRLPSRWLILAGIILAAFNLRPALTSLGASLHQVQEDLGLRDFLLGTLNSTSIICFGLFGLLATTIVRRAGASLTIGLGLVAVAVGLLLRMWPIADALLASTILAGAGIGIVGVLSPAIIRRYFHERLGSVTGLYTMFLCLGGAAGAGLTPPMLKLFGTWTGALAIWALPAAIGFVLWLEVARREEPVSLRKGTIDTMWRSPLAWSITGFMGLQAALAFIVLGWLPILLLDRNADMAAAGALTSSAILSQAVSALITPILADRTGRPGLFVAGVLVLSCVGFLGVLCAPMAESVFWSLVLGLGLGGAFAMALYLIALRSPSAETAAALSIMAQSLGYLGAAAAPLIVGLLREYFVGMGPQIFLFLFISACALPCGLLAADRRREVQEARATQRRMEQSGISRLDSE
ncbi:MFS transporter [Paradevosia shaoguanensis]|uniref:MFS transporter n=1 Tax=Paradevosia shaoguanensis TaxID=1335043 RepID=A0AA41U9I8_9HYPH|nr:MFS transporter [Paradevosia shaoguanensis]MCF1740957.1 MFS transporter [Paradevosia shaoguanensis]MCI0125440.1 MFS transporter [Paradevosia shaoguanensis]